MRGGRTTRQGKGILVGLDPGLRRLALGTLLAAYPGPVPPDWAVDLLADGLAGHTLFGTNIHDPAQVAASTAALRAGRPDVIVAIDEEGGDVTRLAHATGSPYPGNAALGAVDDPDLTRQVYAAIGAELAALGITVDLAPTVDVNTAGSAELQTLPGIGPVLAERIVAWRSEHGRFSSVGELQEVAGIGPSIFAQLESLVRV